MYCKLYISALIVIIGLNTPVHSQSTSAPVDESTTAVHKEVDPKIKQLIADAEKLVFRAESDLEYLRVIGRDHLGKHVRHQLELVQKVEKQLKAYEAGDKLTPNHEKYLELELIRMDKRLAEELDRIESIAHIDVEPSGLAVLEERAKKLLAVAEEELIKLKAKFEDLPELEEFEFEIQSIKDLLEDIKLGVDVKQLAQRLALHALRLDAMIKRLNEK